MRTDAPLNFRYREILTSIVRAYIETGDLARGVALVERSLAGNPRNAHAAHQRVHGFFEAGDAAAVERASSPRDATITSNPDSLKLTSKSRRRTGSSSTTSTRGITRSIATRSRGGFVPGLAPRS